VRCYVRRALIATFVRVGKRLGAAAALFVAALSLTVITSASGHESASLPVLGSPGAAIGGKGFGAVKPRTVYLGGDPTGDFQKLGWHGWGENKSTGYGRGYYPPPGKPVSDAISVPVALHAYSLGTCKGHLAYRRLSIFFKYQGHYTAGAVLGICGRLSYHASPAKN
jgi:hypothetical protein